MSDTYYTVVRYDYLGDLGSKALRYPFDRKFTSLEKAKEYLNKLIDREIEDCKRVDMELFKKEKVNGIPMIILRDPESEATVYSKFFVQQHEEIPEEEK